MKSQTNNKITKANKYPLSYKEINNISTNYLYIQIKNGLNHSQNKNNSKVKYPNVYPINNNQKSNSKQKYSFLNQNKIRQIKSSNDRRINSQNNKNSNYDYSLFNQNTKSGNNRNKIIGIKSIKTQNKNIRDNSFSGYSKKSRMNNSPGSFINNNNKNNIKIIKRNLVNIDNQKLLNNSFTRNKSNKSARNKTPLLTRENYYNNMNKNNVQDNSIILSNYSLFNGNQDIKNINKNNINNNNSIKNKSKIRTNSEHNIFNKNKYNNNHRAFQPKNIFSQFKKKKATNFGNGFAINTILLNNNNKNNLLIGSLLEGNKYTNADINKNNEEKINSQNINNFIKSQNSIKTNDTSVLQVKSNSNLISHGTSSTNNISGSQIITCSNYNINTHYNQKLNVNCHEININLSGIPKKENESNVNIEPPSNKEKEWKGKKIKCMHDLSKTGLSGDEKKVNQDNYFIFKNFVQGFENIYMGVCDGHGYYGHEVSGFIKENLPMNLNHALKKKNLNLLTDDLSLVIKKCFLNENRNLLDNHQIDSDLSGTTCISVIYTPKKLIIANLGDSRCILGKYVNNKWSAENLSRDHKPTIQEEADRILKIGGRIRPMRDEDGEFIGPLRVYMKDKEMPGLAMTRSFGDYFGSLAGTISEPEVTEHILSQEDKFIILASDGLFEFIESEVIVEYVKDYYEKNDIVGCCEFLYKESSKKWLEEEEDTIDDITIILVFFEDIFE